MGKSLVYCFLTHSVEYLRTISAHANLTDYHSLTKFFNHQNPETAKIDILTTDFKIQLKSYG